jgi:hypothetical protein
MQLVLETHDSLARLPGRLERERQADLARGGQVLLMAGHARRGLVGSVVTQVAPLWRADQRPSMLRSCPVTPAAGQFLMQAMLERAPTGVLARVLRQQVGSA